MALICVYCKKDIPKERIEALIEMRREMTCISCSKEQKVFGVQVYQAKHTPSVVIIPNLTDGTRNKKRNKQLREYYRHNRHFLK